MYKEILRVESNAATTDEIIAAINAESDILTGNGISREEVEAEIRAGYIIADGKKVIMIAEMFE